MLAHDAVGGPAVLGRSSQAQGDLALPPVDVFGRLNGRSQVLGVDRVRDDGVALLPKFSNVELQFRWRQFSTAREAVFHESCLKNTLVEGPLPSGACVCQTAYYTISVAKTFRGGQKT